MEISVIFYYGKEKLFKVSCYNEAESLRYSLQEKIVASLEVGKEWLKEGILDNIINLLIGDIEKIMQIVSLRASLYYCNSDSYEEEMELCIARDIYAQIVVEAP